MDRVIPAGNEGRDGRRGVEREIPSAEAATTGRVQTMANSRSVYTYVRVHRSGRSSTQIQKAAAARSRGGVHAEKNGEGAKRADSQERARARCRAREREEREERTRVVQDAKEG